MTIQFNVIGSDRKRLVKAISTELNTEANYLGAPKFEYEVGDYTISQNGTVTGPDNRILSANLENNHGFIGDTEDYDDIPAFEDLQLTEREELGLGRERRDHPGEDGMQPGDVPDGDETDILSIDLPLDGFNPEILDNLCKLVSSKGVLIKKALGADALHIQMLEDKVSFPWFKPDTDSEHIAAYSQFITCLAETAKTKKRVTAKEQDAFENEKFAMRVWLIGLGMKGKEFSLARKLLMANLGGNSGFRYGAPDSASPAKIRIPAPIPNETAEQKAKRELIQLWAKNDKRKEFIKSHREWGIWITTPELGLTYFRYDLSDGGRILAMEYQRENPYSNEEGLQTITTYFLWDGEYFTPHASSEYTIVDRLKNLKTTLQKELRSEATVAAEETDPAAGEPTTAPGDAMLVDGEEAV